MPGVGRRAPRYQALVDEYLDIRRERADIQVPGVHLDEPFLGTSAPTQAKGHLEKEDHTHTHTHTQWQWGTQAGGRRH
jgi:hypothetical protein